MYTTIRVSNNSVSVYIGVVCGRTWESQVAEKGRCVLVVCWVTESAYYPSPTGEFTGSSVGHNYLRKNGMNLPIVALNRSLRDLSIGV